MNQLNNNGFNGTNSGQGLVNNDYTLKTESLVGQPSGYFQNNNSDSGVNNQQSFVVNNYTASTSTTMRQPNNGMQNSVKDNSSALGSVKDFTQNTVNAIAPYIPTYYVGYGIGIAQNTLNKLGSIDRNVSDINKHQYVSCIGSSGGPLATVETIAGGVKKEIDDYNKKMNNENLLKQYGGKWGVIGDGIKDLGNDVIGAWKGLWANNPYECEELLPAQYRKKKKYW